MRRLFTPEISFGELYTLNHLDNPPQTLYSKDLESRQGYEQQNYVYRDIAKNIDQVATLTTIEVINSRRRYYKIFGKFPSPVECLKEILICKPNSDLKLEDVSEAYASRDKIIELMLHQSNCWVEYCSRHRSDLEIIHLNHDDIQAIAEDTVIKLVDFRYNTKDHMSYGIGIIKLASASILNMIIFHERYSNINDYFLYNDRFRDDSNMYPDTDFLETYQDKNISTHNPEDLLILMEENQCQEYYTFPENKKSPTSTLSIADTSTTLSAIDQFRLIANTKNLDISDIMSCISRLPQYYQSTLLHYFGYIEQKLCQAEFRILYTSLPVPFALERLMKKIGNEIPTIPFNLPEMLQKSTNISLILESLFKDNQNETVFRFLEGYRKYCEIPEKERPSLTIRETEIINIIMNNIKFCGITPLRDNKAICDNLTKYLSKKINYKHFSEIVSKSLIPAMNGDTKSSEIFLEKLIQQKKIRQKPTEIVDKYLDKLGTEWILKNIKLSQIHQIILLTMYNHPNLSLVEIGKILHLKSNYVSSCVHTISVKIRSYISEKQDFV